MSHRPFYSWIDRYVGAAGGGASRVTATPTALGEYRTMTKDSGSDSARSDNAPSAGWDVDAANGCRIQRRDWSEAGVSGQPNYWEFFIGVGNFAFLRAYSGTGRSGAVDTRPGTAGGSTATQYGIFQWDKTDDNGVVGFNAINAFASATGTARIGIVEPVGAPVKSCYFDLFILSL